MNLSLDSVTMAFTIIGGGMALSVAGLLLLRKFVDVQHFAAHHQVGGNLLSIMGTLYAVVLGFVVVDVSSDSNRYSNRGQLGTEH